MRTLAALRAYTCGRCGYGIAVASAALPPCPMCRARSWRAETRKDADGR